MTRVITGRFIRRGDAERTLEYLVQELGIDPGKVSLHSAESGKSPTPEERQVLGQELRPSDIVLSAEVEEVRLERALGGFKDRGAALTRTRSGTLPTGREFAMAVASVTKITAASSESFDAAIRDGLERANQTLRGITGLHVVEQKASVSNGSIVEYRVTMEITFLLEN